MDGEAAPLGLVVDQEAPSVGGYQPLGYGQAQARSLARPGTAGAVSAVAQLEHPAQLRLGDATATVAYGDDRLGGAGSHLHGHLPALWGVP